MRDTRQAPATAAFRRSATRAFAAGGLGLLAAGLACAAEGAAPPPARQFPVGQVFTFLFLMLGPFKIIGPFAHLTRGADPATANRIAWQSSAFAIVALLVAAFLGETILAKYGIPVQVLSLSAGIILFLVALLNILQQFHSAPPVASEAPAQPAPPTLRTAISPLAFPTIVTPYGIAALVVFLALAASVEAQLTIGAIVVAIMLLNLAAMRLSRRFMPVLSLVLPILGAVLGIIQVALGLQIIINSLRAIGLA